MKVAPISLLLAAVLILFLLTSVLGACTTRVSPGGAASAPTRLSVVTAVAPVGPPAPTKTVPPTRPAATTAPATLPATPAATYGPVVWTLTVLHTGEVYGDVLPCG